MWLLLSLSSGFYSKSVVVNLKDIWKCLETFFGCHNRGRCYSYLLGRHEGGCQTSYNAQDSCPLPQQRTIQPNVGSSEVEKHGSKETFQQGHPWSPHLKSHLSFLTLHSLCPPFLLYYFSSVHLSLSDKWYISLIYLGFCLSSTTVYALQA